MTNDEFYSTFFYYLSEEATHWHLSAGDNVNNSVRKDGYHCTRSYLGQLDSLSR
jgi:hypothetical protein